MILPEQSSYPRRVQDLRDELKSINGDALDERKRDKILVKFAESQLDLWDLTLALYQRLEGKSGDSKIKSAFIEAGKLVAIGVILWLLTDILPRIFSITTG